MFPDEIRVWADGRCDPIMIRHRTRAHPFARKHVNSTQAGKPGFDQPEWLERAVGVCGARTHASEHPKFDSKSGKFAIFNFLIPYFSMGYCAKASCFGEAVL